MIFTLKVTYRKKILYQLHICTCKVGSISFSCFQPPLLSNYLTNHSIILQRNIDGKCLCCSCHVVKISLQKAAQSFCIHCRNFCCMYSSLLQSNLTFRFDISIHAANLETVNGLTNVLHVCRNKIVIHQSWPNWVMSSLNYYIKTTAPTFKLIIRYDVNYDWRLFQQYFPIYIACHGHIFGRRPILICIDKFFFQLVLA